MRGGKWRTANGVYHMLDLEDSGDAQMTGSTPIWMDYDGNHAGVRWLYTGDASASVKTHIRARADHCDTPWTGTEDTGKDLAGNGWSCGMDKVWEF